MSSFLLRRCAGLALLSLAAVASATPSYLIRALPTIPGGQGSWAGGISNSGQIVGHTYDRFGRYRALVWSATGQVEPLPAPGGSSSKALAVSDSGLIVGWCDAPGVSAPVIWKGGAMSYLPLLPGDIGGVALDVNEKGVVVGVSFNAMGEPMAVAWDGNGVRAVAPARNSWAYRISEGGTGIGRFPINSTPRSVVFTDSGYWALPSLGPDDGSVHDVNDQGTMVGSATHPATGWSHAVRWRAGRIEDLGSVMDGRGARAHGVNNREDYVGVYFPDVGEARPFAVVGGTAIDLIDASSGIEAWNSLVAAQDVNDEGWIIGQGLTTQGTEMAFVLLPEDG